MNTAIAIESLSHDESVMMDLITRAEGYINDNNLEVAEKVLAEGLSYDNWRDKFGPQLLVGIAYCQLFRSEELKKCKETLTNLTEP